MAATLTLITGLQEGLGHVDKHSTPDAFFLWTAKTEHELQIVMQICQSV